MSEAVPALRLSGVSRRFGGIPAVDEVDLTVAAGELFCLLGPSGSGKTTLLRLIGGYLAPDAGRLEASGSDITGLPLERRDIGMVFQNFALFPHMSARRNVMFGLTARGIARAECERRAEQMLERVGLGPAIRDRRPSSLSGGEQQRVALARALVIEPRLLLLDEPMASLDRRLREAMRQELKALHQRIGVTTVLVTHDQEDALFLADRMAIMDGGRLLQVGTPDELYLHPASPFVARFLGDANILQVRGVHGGQVEFGGGLRIPTGEFTSIATGDQILVRPEHMRLTPGSAAMPHATTSAPGTVRGVAFLGADCQVSVTLADGGEALVRTRADALPGLRAGDAVTLAIVPGRASRLPAAEKIARNPQPERALHRGPEQAILDG